MPNPGDWIGDELASDKVAKARIEHMQNKIVSMAWEILGGQDEVLASGLLGGTYDMAITGDMDDMTIHIYRAGGHLKSDHADNND